MDARADACVLVDAARQKTRGQTQRWSSRWLLATQSTAATMPSRSAGHQSLVLIHSIPVTSALPRLYPEGKAGSPGVIIPHRILIISLRCPGVQDAPVAPAPKHRDVPGLLHTPGREDAGHTPQTHRAHSRAVTNTFSLSPPLPPLTFPHSILPLFSFLLLLLPFLVPLLHLLLLSLNRVEAFA